MGTRALSDGNKLVSEAKSAAHQPGGGAMNLVHGMKVPKFSAKFMLISFVSGTSLPEHDLPAVTVKLMTSS